MDKPLLIFDIDGTLTDSINTHQSCYSAALLALGIDEQRHDFSSFKHHTDRYIFREIYFRQFGIYPDATILSSFYEDMTGRFAAPEATINPIAGAAEFIATQLDARQIPYVFATGSITGPALKRLGLFALDHVVEKLACSDEYDTREDIVLNAVEKARKHYHTAEFSTQIILGDGIWDYYAAQQLSMSFLGIGNNLKLRSLLQANRQDTWQDFTGRTLEELLRDAHA